MPPIVPPWYVGACLQVIHVPLLFVSSLVYYFLVWTWTMTVMFVVVVEELNVMMTVVVVVE